MTTPAAHLVRPERLRSFCQAALAAVGVPVSDAAIVADTLVQADLRGVESHGVSHLGGYLRALQAGVVNHKPSLKVERETPTTAVLDADNGMGQVASHRAMSMAIAKAKQSGIGAVGVHNSTHNGALAYYPSMAAAQGLIGYAVSNGPPLVPPYGSVTPVFSTNPTCYAFPTSSGEPVVLDMAATTVARGKVRLAAKKGGRIPTGWATNRRGEPTEDPQEAMDGFLQWIGGPKGYGLAFVVEVLSGVLTGGPFGIDMPVVQDTYGTAKQGHFYAAFNVEAFLPLPEFTSRMSKLASDIKACTPAAGVKEVLLPGELESRAKAQRQRDGIPLSDPVWRELQGLREHLRLSVGLE